MIKKTIQNKFNYYLQKTKTDFSKPEGKFLRQSMLGIMKSKTPIVRQIAHELDEDIPLDKTTKRLRNHINKDGFWKKLVQSHNKNIKHRIKDNDYAVLDITDINKDEANCMEGLDRVWDGDEEEIVDGYLMMNILRVGRSDQELTPQYCKLFSHNMDTKSENTEILSAFNTVDSQIDKEMIRVVDRGGDRKKLIYPFLQEDKKFIIRLNGSNNPRHLYYNGSFRSVPKISKDLDLDIKLSSQKREDGKIKTEYYKAGATRVKFRNPYSKQPMDKELWFVSMKNMEGGYSYYLLNVDIEDREEAIRECFQGYGYGWKIEEYHRHMKQEYELEDIKLMNFSALQNMVTLMMMVMYIVYTEIGRISLQVLCKAGPYRPGDLKGFIYYKLGREIAKILSSVTPRKMIYTNKTHENKRQLKLGFDTI